MNTHTYTHTHTHREGGRDGTTEGGREGGRDGERKTVVVMERGRKGWMDRRRERG